jgi:hypothetical protein
MGSLVQSSKKWVRLSRAARNGFSCPEHREMGSLVQSNKKMGSLVQSSKKWVRLSRAARVNIEIEFVVFTMNCTCGFYHH